LKKEGKHEQTHTEPHAWLRRGTYIGGKQTSGFSIHHFSNFNVFWKICSTMNEWCFFFLQVINIVLSKRAAGPKP
jgi:hypothetical protein